MATNVSEMGYDSTEDIDDPQSKQVQNKPQKGGQTGRMGTRSQSQNENEVKREQQISKGTTSAKRKVGKSKAEEHMEKVSDDEVESQDSGLHTEPHDELDSTSQSSDAKEAESTEGKKAPNIAEEKAPENIVSNVMILTIIVLLAAVVFYMVRNGEQAPVVEFTPGPLKIDTFFKDVAKLEKLFPKQNTRFWRTVKASAIHVLNETNPKYPMVILMASQTDNSHLSSCIAKKISTIYESALNLTQHFSWADIEKFKKLKAADQKKKLDDDILAAFKQRKRRAFVIENLQSISPEAALLLHSYCDNVVAPFKDVFIALTFNVDEKDLKVDNNDRDGIENYIETLWSAGLNTDKVKALLGRVANNIVVVEREDADTVKNVCT